MHIDRRRFTPCLTHDATKCTFKIKNMLIGITYILGFAGVIQVAYCQVALTSNSTSQAEYSSLQLNCILQPPALDFVYWRRRSYGAAGFITVQATGTKSNGQCENDPPAPPSYMSCSCRSMEYTCVIKDLTRGQDGDQWRCVGANGAGTEINSTEVTVQISIPISSVEISQSSDTVRVVENSTQTFICQTTWGKPAATITWYKLLGNSEVAITTGIWSSHSSHKDGTIQVTSNLTITVWRADAGYRVFCRATNGGDTVQSTRMPRLDIVYPPTDGPVIEDLPDAGIYTMIRGSSTQQRLTCSITGGNPLPTLSWNCYGGTHNGSTQGNIVTLTVYWTAGVNVDSTCTCTALHSETTWARTKSVPVTVLYRSAIIAFYANAAQGVAVVEASEGTPLKLTCVTESNPLPNITLTRNGVMVQKISSVRQMEYNKPSSSCEHDMGEYSCLSQNELNPSPEKRTLYYYVLCKPRLSPFTKPLENITGGLHSSVDLSVTVVAYPAPKYIWQKRGESGWRDVKPSARISIFTSDDQLQSNISISDIQEADFGSYRVEANNSQGGLSSVLYLSMASFIPEIPRYFSYTQPLHPQTSARFYWLTGFNGGYMQTFYIEYKQTDSQRWNQVSVDDISVPLMDFTVDKLNPATEYQARIYVINKIGSSDISDTITFTTLASNTCASQKSLSQIGPIVGGVVPGILLVVVIAVLVYLRLTYNFTKKGRQSHAAVYADLSSRTEITNQVYEGLSSASATATADMDNQTHAPKTHYEDLTSGLRSTGEYSSLQCQLPRDSRLPQSRALRTNDLEPQDESAYQNTRQT